MSRTLRSPFSRQAFTPADADRLAATLKALADPIRLRILAALHHEGRMAVTDIVAALNGAVSQPTVSHHLKILDAAGLTERVKEGVYVVRELDVAALEDIGRLLIAGDAE